MPPTIRPRRARVECAAMNPSVVSPSSIGSSGRPTLRIWKKWSITQMESMPAASASRTIRARVGPMASGPPGQVNEEICRPAFTAAGYRAGTSAEEVVLPRHDEVADRALAERRVRAPDERHGPRRGLAEGELRGRGDLVGDGAHG